MARGFPAVGLSSLALIMLLLGRAVAASAIDKDTDLRAGMELYASALEQRGPGLVDPLVDYAVPSGPAVACAKGRAPRTYAVLVGNGNVGLSKATVLEGPEHDVRLLASVLEAKGVAAKRIVILADKDATRPNLARVFKEVAEEVGCEDRVIFHFSGHAAAASKVADHVLAHASDLVSDADFKSFFGPDTIKKQIARLRAMTITEGDMQKYPDLVSKAQQLQRAYDDDVALLLYDTDPLFHEVVRGHDVSDFMLAIRNKGAHAIAVLDGGYVALAALEMRQRVPSGSSDWRFQFSRGGVVSAWPQPVLLQGHGSYAVFYAADDDENSPELNLPKGVPDPTKYGLFTYSVASGLIEAAEATPRTMGDSLQRQYETAGRTKPHPRIEASDPDLVLVAELQPPPKDPISITNPKATRGAAVMEKAEVVVEGSVDWSAPTLGVMIDGVEAELSPDGRFERTVPLKTGLNTLNVIAITADSRLHKKTLDLVYQGDRQALEGSGERYAVVIANQTYDAATGMPNLSTPFADADALAAVLSAKYGFRTELGLPGGKTVPLVLKDATKRDIETALFQLGKVAGAKDTVLVFYAGHGVFEQVTSIAYWVPSDAEQGFEPSYLSAADISAAIQRIQAGSVILISDSCYSGALIRGGGPAEGKISEDKRTEALLKLQSRRSRILITSGNNEPVADSGGGGHSVFARALLDGLEKMDHDAFSARELFDGYILQQVSANADQEPQYRPLEKVGHEGGDFVFVRKAAN